MEKDLKLSEDLLEGWLKMSMTIWNERLVKAMTYNESMVCNLLYKRYKTDGAPLTATYLCEKLQIRKPQMNVILNRLEKDGMITRERSKTDKRNVEILLTEKGVPVYEKAHEEILHLPEALIARMGEERARLLADMMHEVADGFAEVMKEASDR